MSRRKTYLYEVSEELHQKIQLSKFDGTWKAEKLINQLKGANHCEWLPNWHRLEQWIQHEMERTKLESLDAAIECLQALRAATEEEPTLPRCPECDGTRATFRDGFTLCFECNEVMVAP